MYCSAGNIDMLSIATFFPLSLRALSHTSLGRDENPGNEVAVTFFHLWKRKDSSPFQHTVDNEVSFIILTRLTFYEKQLIGPETSFRFDRIEKMQGLSRQGQKQTVRNNEVSVLSGCP